MDIGVATNTSIYGVDSVGFSVVPESVTPSLSATLTPTTVAHGGEITLSGTASDQDNVYVWLFDDDVRIYYTISVIDGAFEKKFDGQATENVGNYTVFVLSKGRDNVSSVVDKYANFNNLTDQSGEQILSILEDEAIGPGSDDLCVTLSYEVVGEGTIVTIGSGTAPPNEEVTMPIMILNVTNYGTGTINVTYNSSVVHVTDVSSSAQSIVLAWNVDNITGLVGISALYPPGVSGDVIFANVTYKAVGSVGDSTTLNLDVVYLVDTIYNDIPCVVDNGTFTITGPPTLTITATPSPASVGNVTIVVNATKELESTPTVTVTPNGFEPQAVNMTNETGEIGGGMNFTGYFLVTESTQNGVAQINANGTDLDGNIGYADRSFIIDTQPPTITPPPDQTLEQDAIGNITWAITDVNPNQYWVLRNGTQVVDLTSYSSGIDFNVSINTTTVGAWNYTIIANDAANNIESDGVIIVIQDITPPAISNVTNATPTTNSVMITWDTDEASDSLVKYGTEPGSYTLEVYNATDVTSHSIDLTELSASTTHYYVVNSTDPSGNSAQSAEHSFTTATPPDTIPPASIMNLINITYEPTYINWTWTNPSDFNYTMVYINGTWEVNVSKPTAHYNDTELSPETEYTISTHTVDTTGNINTTWENATAWTAPAPPVEYIPPDPVDLQNTTGYSWVNHTWQAGSGNVTDSYNVSINGTWYNTTTNTYYNNTPVSAHGWSNVTVWAFNTSGSGSLSAGSVSDNVQIPNNAIIISDVSASYSLAEGETLSIDANYTDADGDTGTFDDNSTEWNVNSTTGIVSWVTVDGDQGTYYWYINVSDGYGSVSTQEFTVTVGDSAPTAPTTIQNTTGNFYIDWTWTKGSNSDYTVVEVDDVWKENSTDAEYNLTGLNAHDTKTVQLREYNSILGVYSTYTNQTTTIPNNPITLSVTQTYNVIEGQTVFISDTSSSDVDSDTPTYSCNHTDLFTDFSTSTGKGNWTTDGNDVGTYYVDIGVSDGYGSIDNKTLTITVTDATPTVPSNVQNTTGNFWINWTWTKGDNSDFTEVRIDDVWQENSTDNAYNASYESHASRTISLREYNSTLNEYSAYTNQTTTIPNNPPVLDIIGNRTVDEGQLLGFTVTASDPDEDPLTYSASNLPGGASFDSNAQTFSWTPTYEQAGSYPDVCFEVSDGVLINSENITITVLDVNRAPVLDLIGDKTVDEGSLLEFAISATDPDGDVLSYSANNMPVGAAFDAVTRTFSWTPTYEQAGSYPDVCFEVSDGVLINSENITITVNDIDITPPTISNLTPANSSYVTTATPTISVTISDDTSGIDTASVVMKVDTVDVTTQAIVTTTSVSYTPTDNLGEGSHSVTVDVDDNAGNSATQASWSFTVDITPPVVTIDSVTTPTNEDTQTIAGSYVEDNLDVIVVTCNGAEATVTIVDGTYSASITLSEGLNNITVTATDLVGNVGTNSTEIFLDTTAPTITNVTATPYLAVVGDLINITAEITDSGSGVNVSSPIAYLQRPDETNVATIQLQYDVGSNIYRGTWNTTGFEEGTYLVDVYAKDNAGNEQEAENASTVALAGVEDTFTTTINITANEIRTIDASEVDTILEIITIENVTDAVVSIVKYSENPVAEGVVGALDLDKYIDITTTIPEDAIDIITIKVHYTDDEVSAAGIDESTLKLYWWNETAYEWQEITPGGVNTGENYVWGNTTHFSLYGLFGQEYISPTPHRRQHQFGGGRRATPTPTPSPTPTPTATPTVTPTPTPTVTPTPTPVSFFENIMGRPGAMRVPGFEAVFAILGLLTVAYWRQRW